MNEKPVLYLINPAEITGDTLAELFEKLTGEKSTPEQIEEMQRELNGTDKKE